MSETAKALGLGQSFKFEGVDYKIAAPEYEYTGEFELWLENRALDKIERQRGKIPEDIYRARHEAMVARVGSGVFERGQPEHQKAMESYEGLKEFMWILMRPVNPGIKRDVVEKMFQVAYQDMMARVALAIAEANPPKAQAATSDSPPSAPSSPTATTDPV